MERATGRSRRLAMLFPDPRLSPDGTKVAYSAYPDAQGANGPGYEIYVSSTDGSGAAIDVSNNPGWDWLPAGRRTGPGSPL